MIARALIVAACFVSHAALAAQPPRNAAEFAQLPALGKLIEGGMEKDYRFRTYLVSKRPTSTGAISIFVGDIHMRVQDVSGGTQRRPIFSNGDMPRAAAATPTRSASTCRASSRRKKPRPTSR
jgi:hypothetical protein